ncbi:PREDICTED: zinc finger and BTB domain-containing protein 5-like [Branchiostoma belcheri]|uniref:Zinc finger and BTB domain-containing protein 5-like n=1 Tax=Branchiostoma belcheri TaxID=7741 RepID=A0A6P4XZ39_BRABE|nr:PREDICTED: zinc finger and BTB domain-containing protein 5-like [Branchiostoma belcheri]
MTCNITVKIEGRYFPAHKIILCASSGYFETLFKAQTGETREVELSGLTTQGFSAMLEMMYASQVQISTSNVMEVQVAASYLHVMDVVADCTQFLTNSLASGHMMSNIMAERVLQYPSHPARVLQHLDSLRKEHPSSCDITIIVKDKSFPAHKFILMASSGYLQTVLSGKQNIDEIELQGLAPEGLSAILDMMYTSQLQLTAKNVIDVQVTASYLHMMDMVADCTQFLTECIASGCMTNNHIAGRDCELKHGIANPNSETGSLYQLATTEKSKHNTDNPNKSSSDRSTVHEAPSPVQQNWAFSSNSSNHSNNSESEVVIVKRESEDLEDVRTSEGQTQQQTNALYFEEVYMDSRGVGSSEREQSQALPVSNIHGNDCHQQGQGIQELQTKIAFSDSSGMCGVLTPPQNQFQSRLCQQECDIMHYSREHMLDKHGTNNLARNWFRRVVRETVNLYQITGLRSVHIDDAMKEVFRRCPSLNPDDVWDIRRQFRNFISNKTGHLSRKERGYLVPSRRGGGQRRTQDTPLSPASSTSSANVPSGGEDSMEPHEQEDLESSEG